jgi:RNA polymerase sigma-70 factor, ECF subfamily
LESELKDELLPKRQLPVAASLAPTPSGEQELIARILAGEKELFYQLIEPHQRRIYLAAWSILRNEADAEDAAQDAILKAFTHLGQFRVEARFSTWLIQIAINEARMRIRKQHSEIMKPLIEQEDAESDYKPQEFADWREIPSEALERKEIRNALEQALAGIAQKYREVFLLRDVQHLSIEEAAEALGLSPAAVKTRLLRARLMLRDLLAPGVEGFVSGGLQFKKGNKPW